MARPLRIEYTGAWYHVMNRGAGRKAIYRQDGHRRLFLALLDETSQMFCLQIHAYCLMANHYHLLVCTPEGNLGRAMRHLNGVYTQRYNRRERTDGPLFRGRYKAVLIDADRYLLAVSRYVHRNPVAAGIVATPARYRWSSYRAYIGQAAVPAWLYTAKTLSMIGQRARQRRYRAFVDQGVDVETQQFYGQARHGPIFGSDAFKRELARRLRQRGKPQHAHREIPEARRLGPAPSAVHIATTVARAYRVPVATVLHAKKGRGQVNRPRSVALYLARRVAGWPLEEIADSFNLTHYGSVSGAVTRLEDQMHADQVLAKQVQRLARSLRNH